MLILPIHSSEYDDSPSGCSTPTPPFHCSASVPFKWEQEPGKPIPCTTLIPYSEPAICMKKLIPPPRMSCAECRITNAPSHATFLDRFSLRLVEGCMERGQLGHMERTMSCGEQINIKVRRTIFWSRSWSSCKIGVREGFGGSFEYPSYAAGDFDDGRECCSEIDRVGEQMKMGKSLRNTGAFSN